MHAVRLSALALALTLCPLAASAQTQDETPEAPAPSPEAAVEDILSSLTVRQKVAQVVMPWLSGAYSAFDAEALADALHWVDSLEVGGIIISIGSPMDIAVKLNYLQQRSRLPLLIAADLESGSATRLLGGTPFPRNMGVAAAGSELDAYQVGRISALEGRAVGIHIAYAPVADVNNNPDNPIINVRSYGEDPYAVARLVSAEVRGLQDHGMVATVKHFPGHGDTGTDSHVDLPVITAGWARLDSLELVPFRAAIRAGAGGVMSAHIALPGVDGTTKPATMVPAVLTGILRDSLGFHGLVVTDALSMGGVVRTIGPGEAAVEAFLAGADILLQPADPFVAVDAMATAVVKGRIPMERLDASVRRVLLLKVRQGLFNRRTVPLDSIPLVVGSAAYDAVAEDITSRSLVLVKDSGAVVAHMRRAHPAVAIISVSNETQASLGNTLTAELRSAGVKADTFRLWPASGPASYDSARAVIRRNPITVFVTAVRPTAWSSTITLPPGAVELINTTAQWNPTVLVSLGSPYLIAQTPGVAAYILGWSNRSMSEQAVGRALSGAAGFTGRSPITLPPTYPIGAGIMLGGP